MAIQRDQRPVCLHQNIEKQFKDISAEIKLSHVSILFDKGSLKLLFVERNTILIKNIEQLLNSGERGENFE